MSYPKWVYHIREDITRENMRIYDKQQELIREKCLELAPDFYKLGLRERSKIRDMAKELVDMRGVR